MQTPDSMNITMEEVMDKKLAGAMKEIHKIIDGTYRGCVVAINPGLRSELPIIEELNNNNCEFYYFSLNSCTHLKLFQILQGHNNEQEVIIIDLSEPDVFDMAHYDMLSCILNEREKKEAPIQFMHHKLTLKESTINFKGRFIVITPKEMNYLEKNISNKKAIIDMRL